MDYPTTVQSMSTIWLVASGSTNSNSSVGFERIFTLHDWRRRRFQKAQISAKPAGFRDDFLGAAKAIRLTRAIACIADDSYDLVGIRFDGCRQILDILTERCESRVRDRLRGVR